MISKCIKACFVSSALASTMVPGNPQLTCGYAKSTHENQGQKVSQNLSHLATVRWEVVSSQQLNTNEPTVRRPLGHFRMTAYTR